jgi:PilZ domain-containing protein
VGKFLDGAMIPRGVRRMFDERSEPRTSAESQTAVLTLRGRKHVVRLLNVSSSGAMLVLPMVPHIGEEVSIQLLGHRPVAANVRWVRDGKIGINFLVPLE